MLYSLKSTSEFLTLYRKIWIMTSCILKIVNEGSVSESCTIRVKKTSDLELLRVGKISSDSWIPPLHPCLFITHTPQVMLFIYVTQLVYALSFIVSDPLCPRCLQLELSVLVIVCATIPVNSFPLNLSSYPTLLPWLNSIYSPCTDIQDMVLIYKSI